jgi:hypothetical protein
VNVSQDLYDAMIEVIAAVEQDVEETSGPIPYCHQPNLVGVGWVACGNCAPCRIFTALEAYRALGSPDG